jgi:hypothetical protein
MYAGFRSLSCLGITLISYGFCPLHGGVMVFAHLSVSTPKSCSDVNTHECPPSSVHRCAPGLHVFARFVFLTRLTPSSPSASPTRAPLQRCADQCCSLYALNTTLSPTNTPRHQVRETPRFHLCRAPFLSHQAPAYCNLSVSSACSSAPPRRGASRVHARVRVDQGDVLTWVTVCAAM